MGVCSILHGCVQYTPTICTHNMMAKDVRRWSLDQILFLLCAHQGVLNKSLLFQSQHSIDKMGLIAVIFFLQLL